MLPGAEPSYTRVFIRKLGPMVRRAAVAVRTFRPLAGDAGLSAFRSKRTSPVVTFTTEPSKLRRRESLAALSIVQVRNAEAKAG